MADETFFTVVGCMDGRCVEPVREFGKHKFRADFADTITEPGIVKMLSDGASKDFLDNLQNKLSISIEKHKSKGILVDGHAECAGDPVPDELQKEQIKKAVSVVRKMVEDKVSVVGLFIHRASGELRHWEADQVSSSF